MHPETEVARVSAVVMMSRAHYSLGLAYVMIEEPNLAKKQFKKVLKIDPENEDAKNQLTKLNEY